MNLVWVSRTRGSSNRLRQWSSVEVDQQKSDRIKQRKPLRRFGGSGEQNTVDLSAVVVASRCTPTNIAVVKSISAISPALLCPQRGGKCRSDRFRQRLLNLPVRTSVSSAWSSVAPDSSPFLTEFNRPISFKRTLRGVEVAENRSPVKAICNTVRSDL